MPDPTDSTPRKVVRPTYWALEMIAERNLSDASGVVLLALAIRANDDLRCWPGIDRLARETAKSPPTVRRALDRLVAEGLIHRQKRRRDSSITTLLVDSCEITSGVLMRSLACAELEGELEGKELEASRGITSDPSRATPSRRGSIAPISALVASSRSPFR